MIKWSQQNLIQIVMCKKRAKLFANTVVGSPPLSTFEIQEASQLTNPPSPYRKCTSGWNDMLPNDLCCCFLSLFYASKAEVVSIWQPITLLWPPLCSAYQHCFQGHWPSCHQAYHLCSVPWCHLFLLTHSTNILASQRQVLLSSVNPELNLPCRSVGLETESWPTICSWGVIICPIRIPPPLPLSSPFAFFSSTTSVVNIYSTKSCKDILLLQWACCMWTHVQYLYDWYSIQFRSKYE